MSGEGTNTIPPRVGGSERGWPASGRSWQGGSTSSSQNTKRRPSTPFGRARPLATDAGGVVAARTDAPPPVYKMPTLDARDPKAMTEIREGLRVGSPESPFGPSPLPGYPGDAHPFGVLGGHQGGPDAEPDSPSRGAGR